MNSAWALVLPSKVACNHVCYKREHVRYSYRQCEWRKYRVDMIVTHCLWARSLASLPKPSENCLATSTAACRIIARSLRPCFTTRMSSFISLPLAFRNCIYEVHVCMDEEPVSSECQQFPRYSYHKQLSPYSYQYHTATWYNIMNACVDTSVAWLCVTSQQCCQQLDDTCTFASQNLTVRYCSCAIIMSLFLTSAFCLCNNRPSM